MDDRLGIPSPRGAEVNLSSRLRAFVDGVWRIVSEDPDADTSELRAATIEGLALWIGSVDRINGTAIRSTFRRFFQRGESRDRIEMALSADIRQALNASLIDNSNLIVNIDQQQRRLVREIFRTPELGASAPRLREALNIGKRRATVIARDQTAKLNGTLSDLRHQSAGATSYQWSTSGDERVRELHGSIDGTVYRYGEPTGAEQGLPPGQPILCRCVSLPVFEPLSDET